MLVSVFSFQIVTEDEDNVSNLQKQDCEQYHFLWKNALLKSHGWLHNAPQCSPDNILPASTYLPASSSPPLCSKEEWPTDLVLRECVSSYMQSQLIQQETAEDILRVTCFNKLDPPIQYNSNSHQYVCSLCRCSRCCTVPLQHWSYVT